MKANVIRLRPILALLLFASLQGAGFAWASGDCQRFAFSDTSKTWKVVQVSEATPADMRDSEASIYEITLLSAARKNAKRISTSYRCFPGSEKDVLRCQNDDDGGEFEIFKKDGKKHFRYEALVFPKGDEMVVVRAPKGFKPAALDSVSCL